MENDFKANGRKRVDNYILVVFMGYELNNNNLHHKKEYSSGITDR